MGPQSVPQVAEAWRDLRRELPGCRHPRLDARRLRRRCSGRGARSFPVVDRRDRATAGFTARRAIRRSSRASAPCSGSTTAFAEDLTPARLSFGRDLALVAEHTWGVDIKSYLRDATAWDRPAFEAMRKSDYRFRFVERSWAEQRAYLDRAVANLAPPDRALAEAALAETDPVAPAGGLSDRGWSATLAPATGDVMEITAPSGARLTGQDGPLFAFRHESYDADDIRLHMDSYLMHGEEWAILDHGKPGLESARTAESGVWAPEPAQGGFTMPERARRALGAPDSVGYSLRADGDALILTLTLRGKPANRMSEAGFLHVTLAGALLAGPEDGALARRLRSPRRRPPSRGRGRPQLWRDTRRHDRPDRRCPGCSRGGGLHALAAGWTGLVAGPPGEPLQQQVGDELPDVVGGRSALPVSLEPCCRCHRRLVPEERPLT
jgi:hypothetical protein